MDAHDRKVIRKYQERQRRERQWRDTNWSDAPAELPVAVREYEELAAIADDHAALVAKAAETVEARQVARYGYVTSPAPRAYLAKLSNHDLEYLISHDPRGYSHAPQDQRAASRGASRTGSRGHAFRPAFLAHISAQPATQDPRP
jgi:phage FluMu protein gp41